MSSPWVLEYSSTVINEYLCPKIRDPKIISWEIYRVARFQTSRNDFNAKLKVNVNLNHSDVWPLLMICSCNVGHSKCQTLGRHRLNNIMKQTIARRCTRHIQGIGAKSACVHCLQGTFWQTLASACWGWVWSAITTMQRRQAALQKSKNQLHVGEASVIHSGTFSIHVALIENYMNLTKKAFSSGMVLKRDLRL